jgi:uncharacterized protein YajQ (UPF0234 family)
MIPINASPKVRFGESPQNLKQHKDILENNSFNRGADFALLQYQFEQVASGGVKDGNTAMMMGLKLQGAVEFLQTFKLLAETEKPLPPKTTPTLDHSV